MDIKTLNEITRIITKHSSEDDVQSAVFGSYDEIYLGGPNPDRLENKVTRRLADLGCVWDEDEDSWYVAT